MAETIYLIDGTAFAYRSYFAIRNLTNSKGEATNAAYGYARVLLKLLREQNPTHIAVVFDAPGGSFREQMYPEYKANREKTPDDLISQMPMLDRITEALGLPMLRVAGVEADDVIGTLARRAEAAGMDAVIVSGDKDLLQLVTNRVRVYDPNKGDTGAWYGEAEVVERFGVPPGRVADALGIMGDASDNVPGVRGIGPKTAKDLLARYGSIEGLYEHLDELKGKQRERLEEDRETALLSRELTTIRTDISLDREPGECRRVDPDPAHLAAVFAELDFQSLADDLLPDPGADETLDYRAVTDDEELRAVAAELRAAGRFAVDTETTSTDPMRARLVGISLSCHPRSAWYVPVGHTATGDLPGASDEQGPGPDDQLPLDIVTKVLGPLLADPGIGKTGHNIKYDMVVLERAGLPVQGVFLDTMVASYLTDPSRIRHNLGEVSLHYLKRKMIPITGLIGTGSKAITFDQVPIAQACEYACEDADITWRLTETFGPLLRENGLDRLFDEVELPLISVLARMEQTGIAIDLPLFGELREEVTRRLAALEAEIHEMAGGPFQINSPKQLQGILFDKLGLKPARKTKTGWSTDVEVLEELAVEHPLPAKLLEYRMLEKLRGTYIEALPKLVHPETGRIHTSFNQAVAATGRLSSSDPNLQNIPVRTELGRRIREGFIPGGAGKKLISADYSQIELRVLAHLSGDNALREAFENGMDVHQDTAARVFGVMLETVTPDMRRQAKAVNFGVVYGISPFGLARNLGISNKKAGEFIDHYFAQYPGVRQWLDDTIARARKDGHVMTLMNRRRYVADLDSPNQAARKAAERVAINTPVQGSAADIIKLAMVRLEPALGVYKADLLLQVHDELVVEAPAGEAEAVADVMRDVMEKAMVLDVPLRVDVGIGDHWAGAH